MVHIHPVSIKEYEVMGCMCTDWCGLTGGNENRVHTYRMGISEVRTGPRVDTGVTQMDEHMLIIEWL
jgi:hypothetical protein